MRYTVALIRSILFWLAFVVMSSISSIGGVIALPISQNRTGAQVPLVPIDLDGQLDRPEGDVNDCDPGAARVPNRHVSSPPRDPGLPE